MTAPNAGPDAGPDGTPNPNGATQPDPNGELPKDHPLWDAPHCIITPHVSGGYALPETLEKILELSIENLERYEKGETLHNIIDFSTGYVKR